MPRTTPAPPSAESTEPESRYQRIYSVVRRIPEGRVATYGQVASLADLPGHARQVGYALHALKGDHGVPWQRVINARGEVSPRSDAGWEGFQRHLLEEEGVEFDGRGRVDLGRFRWHPQEDDPEPEDLAPQDP